MANNNGGNETDVVTRVYNWNAEVKKIWGAEWNKPELEYDFNGRKFYRRTGDAAIYASSPDHDT